MDKKHSLLRRQFKRHNVPEQGLPEELSKFVDAVNQAYWDSDTDRKMLERALDLSSLELLQANTELQAIIKGFPDVFLRLDRAGRILVYKSGDSEDKYPWADHLKGKYFYDIFGESRRDKLTQVFKQVLETQIMQNIEISLDYENDLKYYEIRLLPMDEKQIFVIIRDITERKMAEEQLIYYSLFDPLTNLYNRAYFEKEMHRFQTQQKDVVGLIVCDVDNLKTVNDTCGHDAGDELLMELARVLRQSLRKQDVIARIGGDEFAILLPDSDETALESTCQRIRNTIKEYNQGAPSVPLGVSLGYSVRGLEDQKMIDVFKDADDKMYRDKFNHHRRLSAEMVESILEHMEKDEIAIEASIKRISEVKSELNLRIRSEDNYQWDEELLVYLERINKDSEYLWIMGSEPGPGSDMEAARNYMKAMIILLNIALDSKPHEQ